MTKTEKIAFMIENWEKMTTPELSEKLEASPYLISQWRKRLADVGIVLEKRRGESINWEFLRIKYSNKAN